MRSVNIGVIVEPMPWIEATSNDARGKSVMIGAEGMSGEIPAGAVVIPMIKFKGTSTWVKGTSRPKIDDDGSFAWQRKIARTARIYFVWIDNATMKPSEVRSSTLEHRQVLRT